VTSVEVGDDGFIVHAAIIAEAFGIADAAVHELMKSGEITSTCETGMDDDEGRWRLTFFYLGRTFRLTIDADCKIISSARFDASRRRLGTK
jgi:hypothetical protein